MACYTNSNITYKTLNVGGVSGKSLALSLSFTDFNFVFDVECDNYFIAFGPGIINDAMIIRDVDTDEVLWVSGAYQGNTFLTTHGLAVTNALVETVIGTTAPNCDIVNASTLNNNCKCEDVSNGGIPQSGICVDNDYNIVLNVANVNKFIVFVYSSNTPATGYSLIVNSICASEVNLSNIIIKEPLITLDNLADRFSCSCFSGTINNASFYTFNVSIVNTTILKVTKPAAMQCCFLMHDVEYIDSNVYENAPIITGTISPESNNNYIFNGNTIICRSLGNQEHINTQLTLTNNTTSTTRMVQFITYCEDLNFEIISQT